MSDLPRVLLLGSSGDIGTAIRARFESEGHTVEGTTREDFDLRDRAAIDLWLAKERTPFGVLVHSAGRNFPAPFAELSDHELQACFDANVTGFLTVVRGLMDEIVAQRGRIVVLSSIFGFLSRHGRLAYSMSKHALEGVVKTLAIELGPHGVLVNSVSPGYIATRLTTQNNDLPTIARLEAAIPLRHLGSAEDVAEAVWFVGSHRNRYITGQNIVVDGGLSVDGGRG